MNTLESIARFVDALRAYGLGMLLWPSLVLRNHWSHAPVTDPASSLAVNLTSYGVRLNHVHLVIESIARGTTRPGRLLLWLSEEDGRRSLPRGLRRLQRRGLTVLDCVDYKSHKKYYPFSTSELADRLVLVTADDDVYYPRDWLAGLTRAHVADRVAVWCYRSRTMCRNPDGGLAPYSAWPLSREQGPDQRLVPTGVSGVLYPPAVLREIQLRGTDFEFEAPLADDLWLHARAIAAGVKVRRVRPETRHLPVVPSRRGGGLMARNMRGGNDEVISRIYAGGLWEKILEGDGHEAG